MKKMYFLIFFQILYVSSSIKSLDTPDIKISNFDVRQKFSTCYNDGISQNYDGFLTCHVGFAFIIYSLF